MAVLLLVDDNNDSRGMFSTLLELRGHTCIQAADGAAGVQLAKERRPDLILLDIGMPTLDGWGAVALLKADPATASIPVVALSAHELREEPERVAAAGFAAHLRKPAQLASVVEVVDRVLGKDPGAPDR